MKNYALKTKLTIVAMTAMLLSAGGAMSATLLTEDFELPDVSAADSTGNTSGAAPVGWVRSTDGYGATRSGLIDKAAGAFTAADPNTQAYAFRYTNSGLTSGPTQIGLLKGNTVYQVTFEVQEDVSIPATDYACGLVLFEPGASRTDCRGSLAAGSSPNTIAVLTYSAGNDAPNGSFMTNTFTFTSSYSNAQDYVGKELAVRFGSVASAACIDNVIVETLSEDTTAPTIAQADIVAGAASVTAWSNLTYTLTFDDWIPAHLLDVNTFTNVAATDPATWDLVSISQVASNELALTLLPTTNGNLQLQITTNLLDAGLNNLAAAVTDADTVTVAAELIPPTVTSIVDNANSGPVLESGIVTYTVYFDEPVDSNQVTVSVFEDGGTSGASIDSVTALPDGVYESYAPSYEVVATAGSAGTMILRIKAAATIQDRAGNNLDTTSAVPDDTTINVISAVTQAGTWIADQNGLWGHAANWQDSNVAYGTDSTATFPNNLSVTRTVTLDRDITIGGIDFQETGQDLTISGTQALTLDVTSGAPDISVSNRTLTISSVIAGTDGLAKSGAGTLTLSGVNTFTNDITIAAGTLTFSTLNAWGGSGKNVTFAGNGTLGGADGYTAGQMAVSDGVVATIINSITVTTATGTGTLDQKGSGKTLSILDGTSFLGPLLTTCTYSPNNLVQFKSLGDGAGAGNLKFGGGTSDGSRVGTMRLYGDVGPLILNNRQVEVTPRTGTKHGFRDIELKNDNATAANSWVINTDLINNESYREKVLVLRGSNTGDNEFAGTIPDGANQTLITKQDSGKWILSGKNTYSGVTTVSGGTLVLRGEESIVDTGTVNISGGKVEIDTREKVDVLQFNGTASVPATGIWGSSTSGAENQNDTYFTGNGLLYVGVDFPPTGTVLIVR